MSPKPKPTPTPWRGDNPPTANDQKNLDNYNQYKRSVTNPEPDLIDKIGSKIGAKVNSWVKDARKGAYKSLPKGMTYKPMAGSPNMAKLAAVAKAKKKMVKSGIQKSPTN
jgi:hypothetical protein